eukprot:6200035-Pleurochrysis_carterae.AAC.4
MEWAQERREGPRGRTWLMRESAAASTCYEGFYQHDHTQNNIIFYEYVATSLCKRDRARPAEMTRKSGRRTDPADEASGARADVGVKKRQLAYQMSVE